jgi:two-component system sensor histidine kinase CpxA
MTRSLYGRIFAAFFAALLLSLIAFPAAFFALTRPRIDRGFRGFLAVEANTAAGIFTRSGPQALQEYLGSLDVAFSGNHYLVDRTNRDVLSSTDRSVLLRRSTESRARPPQIDGKALLVAGDAAGRFTLVALRPAPTPDLYVVLPYFLLLLAVIAGVCWLIAASIASPVRRLAGVVERFGAGDMTARLELSRRDELGDLARAFNRMADRIATLLTAERQLLQDLSHELRSPLARLDVAIELCRDGSEPAAVADRLQAQSNRLTSLVSSLIETVRAEGNLASPAMQAVDMFLLLRDVAEDAAKDSGRPDVAIDADLSAAGSIRGNAELLRRAFENLISNALRHAPPQSRVQVHAFRTAGQLVVSVRDFGSGVPEGVLSRLGTPFFRVDASRTSATGGLGLGLAIARRALHLHGGTLTARNALPGLIMVVSLPDGGEPAVQR